MLAGLLLVALFAPPVGGELSAAHQRTWYESDPVDLTSFNGHVTYGHARIEGGVLGPEFPVPAWMLRAGYDGTNAAIVAGVTLLPVTSSAACAESNCSSARTSLLPFPSLGLRVGPRAGLQLRGGLLEVSDGGLAILRGGLATSDPAIGELQVGWTADLASGIGPFVEGELHGGRPFFARATATLGSGSVAEEKGASFAFALGARW